jgi:hypothetical protein
MAGGMAARFWQKNYRNLFENFQKSTKFEKISQK